MASAPRSALLVVACTLLVDLVACQRPRADTKTAPIPGLDPGGPARAVPAMFVRESLAATREALQAAYRLSLDARIVDAAAMAATLVGAPLAQPPSATWKKGWQIRTDAVEVGTLAELPDFDEAHAMLVAWARRQLAGHPVARGAGPTASPALRFAAGGGRGAGGGGAPAWGPSGAPRRGADSVARAALRRGSGAGRAIGCQAVGAPRSARAGNPRTERKPGLLGGPVGRCHAGLGSLVGHSLGGRGARRGAWPGAKRATKSARLRARLPGRRPADRRTDGRDQRRARLPVCR